MRCCGSACKMANAIRLCHFLLTFFVLYVLLKNTHSGQLAWHGKEFGVLTLALDS